MSVQQQVTALAQAIGADIKQLQAQTSPAGFFRAEPITATATGQTAFTVPGGYTPGAIFVSLNGASLPPADYTATNGTTVVLASGDGIVAGSVLLVHVLSAFEVADALPLGGTAADSSKLGGHAPSYYATQSDLDSVSLGAEFYQRSNILGTVSQSGGVPTGAIIERGSNANGDYVRYADGTMECSKPSFTTASGATTWTFPAVFAAAPSVMAPNISDVTNTRFITSSPPTATSYTLATRAHSNADFIASVTSLTARGRWY